MTITDPRPVQNIPIQLQITLPPTQQYPPEGIEFEQLNVRGHILLRLTPEYEGISILILDPPSEDENEEDIGMDLIIDRLRPYAEVLHMYREMQHQIILLRFYSSRQ